LEKDFAEGKLHPLDLKRATAKYLSEILEPVRKYFEGNEEAKRLYERIKDKVTR